MIWIIELGGERFDLQELLRLRSPSNVEVFEEADRFYLRSAEFKSHTEARVVLDRATEIVSILNGIANLEIENWQNIRVTGVAREEPNGTRSRFLFAESIQFRSRMGGNLTITRADGAVETTTDNSLETFADLATRDVNVSRALRLFGSGTPTWVSLYKILEIIESEIDIDEMINCGWTSKAKIRSFKHTANSVSAIGDDARHGSEYDDPPRSPIPLAEAESLISRLLKHWLRSKQK